jgi:hypothetical protein
MNLQLSDSDDPTEIWPGHAEIDRAGVELAVQMLDEMTEKTDEQRIMVADMCSLDDWQREGLPFRNIVAEYLERARSLGPEAESGFCAVLSDMAAFSAAEYEAFGERYAKMFGIE